MAEEFQATICEGSWWNNITSSRSVFPLGSSPCSVAAHDAGCYSSWHNDIVSDSSLGFLDLQKPQQSETVMQMMGFGLSSSSASNSNWNQSLLERPEGESNFHSVIQEETGIDSSSTIQIDANFKLMNQEFSLDQQSLSCVTTSAGNSTVTCQGLSGNFPVGSASYHEYPASTLIQSLPYEPDPQTQPQNSLFTNHSMAYNSSSTANYGSSSNEILPFLKPTVPKQLPAGLQFSNNTPFWNASAEALSDIRAGVFASSPQAKYQSPTFEEKPNCPAMTSKAKREEAPESATAVKKNVCEPALKRPRIETPSPLPTFKVRKEKLGDRITALQQLVSPFGKTDTASVLHEAIEYIKFLHDQVNVLSTPYMKNGASNIQHQQVCDMKESEGPSQDLRSRGLCLVPISSTFPVANETTVDFWTPTFAGGFIR